MITIHDDAPPKDDDDFELDDDIEDLEPLDDIEDDWDEDDDLDVDFDDESDSEETPNKSNPGQKTFLQKFFIPIVVVIVAAFGGLFMLGQGGGSKPQPPAPLETKQALPVMDDTAAVAINEAANPEIAAIETTEELPPMPTAMQSETSMDLVEEKPEPIMEEKPLTPLPSMDQNEPPPALVDLDDALDDTPFEIRDSAPVTEIEIESIGDEAPLAEFEIDSEPVVLSQNEGMPDVETNMDADEDSILSVLPSDALAQKMEENLAPPSNAASDAINEEIAALEAEKEALSSTNQSLENKIALAENKLATLEEKLAMVERDIGEKEQKSAALKDAVSALESQKAQAEMQAKAEAKKPAPKTSLPKPRTDAKPKTQPKPQQSRVQKPMEWVLRAASPGRASIAAKGSNDLKTIEIGDTVFGLGRITSIQIENGLWVVQGTKGRLSQ